MRQIKFRGYFPSSKVAYYGDLIHVGGRTFITQGDNGRVEVDPDSVAQFVGLDSNGREVYEGDITINRDGNRHMATMGDIFNVSTFRLEG